MTFMSRTFGNMVVRMAYDNQFSGRNQKKLGRARAAAGSGWGRDGSVPRADGNGGW
jgi:hypothetical protein